MTIVLSQHEGCKVYQLLYYIASYSNLCLFHDAKI